MVSRLERFPTVYVCLHCCIAVDSSSRPKPSTGGASGSLKSQQLGVAGRSSGDPSRLQPPSHHHHHSGGSGGRKSKRTLSHMYTVYSSVIECHMALAKVCIHLYSHMYIMDVVLF